jgi:hypothetical protein
MSRDWPAIRAPVTQYQIVDPVHGVPPLADRPSSKSRGNAGSNSLVVLFVDRALCYGLFVAANDCCNQTGDPG